MRIEPANGSVRHSDREPSEHGRRGVVGVAFDRGGAGEGLVAVEVGAAGTGVAAGGEQGTEHHARHGRRRRGTETALEGYGVLPDQSRGRRLHASRRGDLRDRAAHEIAAVDGKLAGALPVPLDAGLGLGVERHLVAQVEGESEAVEPGSEVGRGRGHPDRDAHGC